jgi:hypothetical protein
MVPSEVTALNSLRMTNEEQDEKEWAIRMLREYFTNIKPKEKDTEDMY